MAQISPIWEMALAASSLHNHLTETRSCCGRHSAVPGVPADSLPRQASSDMIDWSSSLRAVISALVLYLLPSILSAATTTCPPAPAAGSSSKQEIFLDNLFSKVALQSSGCSTSTGPLCEAARSDLAQLKDQSLQASIHDAACAANALPSASMTLSPIDKAWYRQRAAFWYSLYVDMTTNPTSVSAVDDGTYAISPATRAQFLGIPPSPTPAPTQAKSTPPPAPAPTPQPHQTQTAPAPSATAPPAAGATTQPPQQPAPAGGKPSAEPTQTATTTPAPDPPTASSTPGDPPTNNSDKPATPTIKDIITNGGYTTITGTAQAGGKVYVCLSKTKPDSPKSCLTSGAAGLLNPSVAKSKPATTPEQPAGNPAPAYVVAGADGSFSAVLDHALHPGTYLYIESLVAAAKDPTPSTISQVPYAFRYTAPFGAAAIGLEVTGASSTDPAAVFLASGLMDLPLDSSDNIGNARVWLNGQLRISGMAQPQSLTGKIGSVDSFASYLATAANANPDQIVQSIDASFGMGIRVGRWYPHGSTFDVKSFRSYGFTEPQTLVTLSLIGSYGAITPLSDTQSQPVVYNLTPQIYNQFQPAQPDAFSGCGDTKTFAGCYAAFVPYDRTHFYRNYQGGVRLKLYAGDYNEGQYRFPLVADLTIGQNEYVTGGKFRDPVLHFGGLMPIPSVDSLYIFGAMDVRASKNHDSNQPQLLLTAPTSGTPILFTDSSVSRISVDQPNRDRYRIGIGVDLLHLISTLKVTSKQTTGQ